jgi:hypothetical protein
MWVSIMWWWWGTEESRVAFMSASGFKQSDQRRGSQISVFQAGENDVGSRPEAWGRRRSSRNAFRCARTYTDSVANSHWALLHHCRWPNLRIQYQLGGHANRFRWLPEGVIVKYRPRCLTERICRRGPQSLAQADIGFMDVMEHQ